MSNQEQPKKFRRQGELKDEPCCTGHGQKCTDCGYIKEEFNDKINAAKNNQYQLLHMEAKKDEHQKTN